jgi:hypothetical protein
MLIGSLPALLGAAVSGHITNDGPRDAARVTIPDRPGAAVDRAQSQITNMNGDATEGRP